MKEKIKLTRDRPWKGGNFRFSKQMERKFFFYLTLAMLLAGVCVKLGML